MKTRLFWLLALAALAAGCGKEKTQAGEPTVPVETDPVEASITRHSQDIAKLETEAKETSGEVGRFLGLASQAQAGVRQVDESSGSLPNLREAEDLLSKAQNDLKPLLEPAAAPTTGGRQELNEALAARSLFLREKLEIVLKTLHAASNYAFSAARYMGDLSEELGGEGMKLATDIEAASKKVKATLGIR
jgi:hypothetical protein